MVAVEAPGSSDGADAVIRRIHELGLPFEKVATVRGDTATRAQFDEATGTAE